MDIIICKNYKLTKKLGSGAFGEIYQAINTKTNEYFAVKLEQQQCQYPQLFYEAKLYQYLLNDSSVLEKGIPNIYYCGQESKYNVMIMDLLGLSLEDQLVKCGRKFSLKCVLQIAEQTLTRIEYIHSKTFIHRDIKPDNFLVGNSIKSHKIYIIDFGLAKRYIGTDGKHIPFKENKNLTGTARYASINTHQGAEQSRRDDLESLGYVLIYFLKGQLPWQNLKSTNTKDKYTKIMEKKISTSIDNLCKGLPKEFGAYVHYCRELKFEDKPNYGYLKGLFKDLFNKMGFENDRVYDWTEIKNETLKTEENKNINMKSTQQIQRVHSSYEEEKKIEEKPKDKNKNSLPAIHVKNTSNTGPSQSRSLPRQTILNTNKAPKPYTPQKSLNPNKGIPPQPPLNNGRQTSVNYGGIPGPKIVVSKLR